MDENNVPFLSRSWSDERILTYLEAGWMKITVEVEAGMMKEYLPN